MFVNHHYFFLRWKLNQFSNITLSLFFIFICPIFCHHWFCKGFCTTLEAKLVLCVNKNINIYISSSLSRSSSLLTSTLWRRWFEKFIIQIIIVFEITIDLPLLDADEENDHDDRERTDPHEVRDHDSHVAIDVEQDTEAFDAAHLRHWNQQNNRYWNKRETHNMICHHHHHHHHQLNVHFLPRSIKDMDSCFPTALGRQTINL